MIRKAVSGPAMVALALSVGGVIRAQEPGAEVQLEAGRGQVTVSVDGRQGPDTKDGQRDKSSQGVAYRASMLQGMTVKNRDDETLGTVKDIVINVREGRVKYAAVSYGGLLGFGDKLFAVPWRAFEHRLEENQLRPVLVLGVDKQTLKTAPGFDQDEWPDFANREWTSAIDRHYGKDDRVKRDRKRGADDDRDARIDVDAGLGRVTVDVDVRGDRKGKDRDGPSKDIVHRASVITGMTVRNPQGKELGSVNDLVVDMDTGSVRYAALSYGGLFGLGDKLFAVPWSAFGCVYSESEKEYELILAIDEATLRKAPGFDQDEWPNFADPKLGQAIDKYYGDARRKNRDR